MIELGDVLKEMGSHGRWYGVATESTLDKTTVAKYENGMYDGYIGTSIYEHDELRQLIRNGHIKKVGHVESSQQAAVPIETGNAEWHKMDAERTRAVYEADESGDTPDTLGDDGHLLWNTVEESIARVDSFGWNDDSLADELIRFEDGSVESFSTVVQAMREGVLVLMRPTNG